MTDSRSPVASWRRMLDFYARYDESPWDERWSFLTRFRRLVVEPLAQSGWGRRLWASQSHEMLIISQVAGFPERFERPRVVIVPKKDESAVIQRLAGDAWLIGEVERPFEACGAEVEAALSWLIATGA